MISFTRQLCRGRGQVPLLMALIFGLSLYAAPDSSRAADAMGLANVRLSDHAEFSYEIAEVEFATPRELSTGAGKASLSKLVKVTIHGAGFRAGAAGPLVWLNGVATLRTEVSRDGRTIKAWFLEPIESLVQAAAQRGEWDVVYRRSTGDPQAFRIAYAGNPGARSSAPVIVQERVP
jgi:hypothetical protein